MKKVYEILTEKTFTISKDVAYIWKYGFGYRHDQLKKNNFKSTGQKIIDDIIKDGKPFTFKIIKSSELPSKEAIMASAKNPIEIHCGFYPNGSFYIPVEQKILISINAEVVRMLLTNEEWKVAGKRKTLFYQELEAERIKSTIAHEVSHWLNDTLHNSNIKKILDKASELNNKDIIKLGQKDVNMTYFEIDALVHGVKQLKMHNKRKWDTFTTTDVFLKYTTLTHIVSGLYRTYGKEVSDIWQKMLLKRLSREKLLGKNMRSFVNAKDI